MPFNNLPRIMDALVDRPLMVHPRTAMTVYNALAGRFGTAVGVLPSDNASEQIDARIPLKREPKSNRFEGNIPRAEDGAWHGSEPYKRTPEGIAIITTDGELVNRGAFVGASSGVVSYEGTKFQFARAARDPKTKAIIWDMNSPGGDAVGAAELAQVVRTVSAIKPVYAISNGVCCSAMYMGGSGATRLFNTSSGLVGSIGVVMLHLDYSKSLDKQGISPTFIFSGEHKVDGNPAEPLTDETTARLQAECDKFYTQFCNVVSMGRGRKLTAKAARDTKALTFIGDDAVSAGLADGVATFEDVLSEATTKIKRQSRSSSSSATRSTKMSGLGIDDGEHEDNDDARINAKAKSRAAKDEAIRAGAHEAALKASNERIAAIIGDSRIKGKHVERALALATRSPAMSAEDVCATVEEMTRGMKVEGETEPKAGDDPSKSLQGDIDATGANGLQTGRLEGTERRDPSARGGERQEPQGGGGWDKHIKTANASLQRRGGIRRGGR